MIQMDVFLHFFFIDRERNTHTLKRGAVPPPEKKTMEKLVIEATKKKLRLGSTGMLCHDGSESYHFRTAKRRDHIKVFVCHPVSYCARRAVICNGTPAVDLIGCSIRELQLQGNGNRLTLAPYSNDSSTLSITMDGKNNSLSVDVVRKRLSITMTGRAAADGEHSLTLSGRVEELFIESSRYFGLNAEALMVTRSANVLCHGSDLMKVVLTPQLPPNVGWQVRERSPPPPSTPFPILMSPPPPPPTTTTSERSSTERPKKRTRLPGNTASIPHQSQLSLTSCPICVKHLPNWACVPCGHMLCPSCTHFLCSKLKAEQLLQCPHAGCNQQVEQVVHTILPLSTTPNASTLSPSAIHAISLD